MPTDTTPFVSASCEGEACGVCGDPAVMKVGEEIMHDDPMPHRHNLTQHLCRTHATAVLQPYLQDAPGCPWCAATGVHPRFLDTTPAATPQPGEREELAAWLKEESKREHALRDVNEEHRLRSDAFLLAARYVRELAEARAEVERLRDGYEAIAGLRTIWHREWDERWPQWKHLDFEEVPHAIAAAALAPAQEKTRVAPQHHT